MDAVYRISSNEVVKIGDVVSLEGYGNLFAMLSDPTYTDGTDYKDPNGDLRVLGYAKINDGGVVRNATQPEIDTFAPAALDDKNQKWADRVVASIQNDPEMRRIVAALIKGIIKEDNDIRGWVQDFMDAVAASTSLADYQSRVAALDRPVDREFQDAKTYIINQVSKDD